MKTVDNFNFSGKKALVRVDFNVPLSKEFKITDDTRITAALPTIKKILKDGGSVILMSHLGRPKEGKELKYSLQHLVNHISDLLKMPILFADDCIGASAVEMSKNLKPGQVLLLENLRYYKEEEKGDVDFSKKLAALGDVYVNDAFGTAHRAHASTTIISQFFPNDKMFGYLIANELIAINKVLNDTQKPYTAIMGGAKVSSKIEIINQLMGKVDNLIIGGGMMFTFAKAMGGNIGNSLVEEDYLDMAKDIIKKAKEKGINLVLPIDTLAADKFENEAATKVCDMKEIPDGWLGMDISDASIKLFDYVIQNSKTILWNGPMGVFEMSNFEKGTKEVALSIAKATKNGAYSLIGGGDSVAAINQFDLTDQVSYVSTGGGALLEYMEGKDLPGISAILK